MANPEHVKWLKEDVKAWNERRERDDFTPDLQGADLRGADLQGADLLGADLWDADLRKADLRKANLKGADLQGADLWGANLRGAVLLDAHLLGANLRGANLLDANLRGAVLLDANLRDAELRGADAMTLKSLSGHSGADSDFIITDFTQSRNLTQDQVDGMRGTKGKHGTLLPDGLSAPDHWETEPNELSGSTEPDFDRANNLDNSPEPDSHGTNAKRPFSAQTIKSSISLNRSSILLTSVALVEQLDEFVTKIQQSNSLDDDFRKDALAFLATHRENLLTLTDQVPEAGKELPDDEAVDTAGKLEIFIEHATAGFKDQFDPKRLGDMAAPTTIVTLSAAVGAACGAPLAGVAFGAWFTGKSTADKLAQKVFDPPKSGD